MAIIGKFAGAMFIDESWRVRGMVGLSMIPRGEVGIIFAELGRVSGIFNNEIYTGMIMVIALTTIVPPLLMKWLFGNQLHTDG